MSRKHQVLSTEPTRTPVCVALTGPAACGKTLIAELLTKSVKPKFLNPEIPSQKKLPCGLDSSLLMNWRAKSFDDDVALHLKEDEANRRAGKLTPDWLTIQPILTWRQQGDNSSRNIFFAGFPRSNFQAGWLSSVFGDLLIVLIRSTPTEVFQGVADRMERARKKGVACREDDKDPRTICRRILISETFATDLRKAHGAHLLEIRRSNSLMHNLRTICDKIPRSFGQELIQRMRDRFRDENSDVSREAYELEMRWKQNVNHIFQHHFPEQFAMAQSGKLDDYVRFIGESSSVSRTHSTFNPVSVPDSFLTPVTEDSQASSAPLPT